MDRPNPKSVTDVPCTCGYLERAANDPDSPIVFDSTTHEYQYEYLERQPSRTDLLWSALFNKPWREMATLLIYHCPWCGGAAPRSKRADLFHAITKEEEQRLTALLGDLRTIEQVIETLGTPDYQCEMSAGTHDKESGSPVTKYFRQHVYVNLSDVAEVHFTEGRDGRVYRELHRKWKGPEKQA